MEGGKAFNPGWHLALDLRNMLLVSRCVAEAALLRTESRGGHTREDHPGMNPQWRQRLLVCTWEDDKVGWTRSCSRRYARTCWNCSTSRS